MDWFLYDRDLRHERVKSSFLIELDESVVVLRIFFGRLEHISNPRRLHHDLHQAGTFSKFVPPDALQIHSPALSAHRFYVKLFLITSVTLPNKNKTKKKQNSYT